MERIVHELVQGSPAWDSFRVDHHGASEAAPMLGVSKNVTRSELLRVKHTGLPKEFSDFVREHILERGHEVEALARPIAEDIIGEELYPCTMSYGKLSASCDGLTIGGDTAFEHKQPNKALFESVSKGILPEEHKPQCYQVLLVTGAERLLFMVSDGTPEHCVHLWVYPDQDWFDRINAGWIQFDIDLASYTPPEVIPAAVAAPILALPAVSIKVEGALALISNLDVFGVALKAFVAQIPEKPSTDQEFADCKAACRALQEAQDKLDAAEAHALGQVASFDEMKRTKALLFDLARTTRLATEKLVTAREKEIREEIVSGGRKAYDAHIGTLNARLGKPILSSAARNIPEPDFAGKIKGKRTVTSLKDAVDTELSRVKIESSSLADKVQINMATLAEMAAAHRTLFADAAQIVLKNNDDLIALIKVRIDAHDKAEAEKLQKEREKIRAEEEAKAKAAADKRIAEELAAAQPKPVAAPTQQPTPVAAATVATPKPAVTVAAANTANPQGTERLRTLIAAALADLTPGELQQSLDAIRGIRAAREQRKSA